MTPSPQSVARRAGDDVLAPSASSLRMRAVNGAASAASTAPRVADPPQQVAAQLGRVLAQTHRPDRDVMPRARVRDDERGCYAVCECGWTTGYCDTLEQAVTVALEHRCRLLAAPAL